MSDEKIEVIANSGYRGKESPKALILRGQRIEVVEIQERWVEERLDDRVRKRFFKASRNSHSLFQRKDDVKIS